MNQVHYYRQVSDILNGGVSFIGKWFTDNISKIGSFGPSESSDYFYIGYKIMDSCISNFVELYPNIGVWIKYNGITYTYDDFYKLQRVLEQEKIENMLESL